MSDKTNNETQPDNAPASAPDEQAASAAPEQAKEQAKDQPAPEAARPPRKRKGRGALLLLLVALSAGGWLIASGRVQLPASVQAKLPGWLHAPAREPQQSQPAQAMPHMQPQPAAPHAGAPTGTRREPIAPPPQPARPALDSAEAEALMQAMGALRAQLEEERAARAAFEAELRAEQRANLVTRLRWIADPASRLPQIRLAWEEIALMPALSDEERAAANEMAALARKDEARLRAWRAALARWIDALQTPVSQDVLPRPSHPWLAWIVGQFHLRPSDAPAARETRKLRQALIEASRRLALEDWPEDGEWRRLRAQLLLKLADLAGENADHADTGLPESFRDIRADSARLTDAARQWLARLLPQADAPANAEEAL